MTLPRSYFAASARSAMLFGLMLLFGLSFQLTAACKEASAGTILVSDRASHSVLRFDSTTGAALPALVAPNSGGLLAPTSMTLGFNGDLYVTSVDGNTGNARILRYNVDTGAFLGVFADTSTNEVLGSIVYSPTTNTILAGSLGSGVGDSSMIYQFNAAGAQTTNITSGTASGRTGLTFAPNGHLFASTFSEDPFGAGGVLEFDTANAFSPLGYFVDPNTESLPLNLFGAAGSIFNGNNLLLANLGGQAILKFNPAGTSATQFGQNVAYPSGLAYAPDGNLLITSLGNNNPLDPVYGNFLFPGSIFKFDINTGATIGGPNVPFITNGASFLPTAMIVLNNPAPEPSSLLLLMGGTLVGARKLRRKTR
jgi:hypothetical protein